MPEWKKVTDYAEKLECNFAVLFVAASEKAGTFNLKIISESKVIYERTDFFPGSSTIKAAKQFLTNHYCSMLEKEVNFMTDKNSKGNGVF